ncbi:EpsG family protein [Idiomarina aminovorans]|uniref:EpsG family protein n=1 Tax=Idiomarina aminovorans TaxID=2914829 RepID=UPI002006B23A|nr:EpsG family protein [Idiomarina sp. ATCH4]MCK7459139.1 EpsG family protein [Idiomarina sp. ATCH4]
MLIYYVTFIILFILGFIYQRLNLIGSASPISVSIVIATLLIIYGFRFEVGVDWFNYIRVYDRDVANSLTFTTPELGYKYLNVLSDALGAGIHGVVFVATLMLLVFSFLAPMRLGINPFYFMALIAPYHLVVAGMNLTSQSIAISIFIYAVTFLMQKRKVTYAFLILFAALFHFSAILLLSFLFIDFRKRYLIPPLLFIFLPVVAAAFLLYGHYFESGMENAGVILRVGFLFPVAFLILAHKKKWLKLDKIRFRLCLVTVLIGPMLLGASLLSSTLADRFSYYFIPLAVLLVMEQVTHSKRRPYDLMTYASPIMFVTALTSFVAWHTASSYIPKYQFQHLFFAAAS